MKISLKDYCQQNNKSFQLAQKYAKDVVQLEGSDDQKEQKFLKTRMNWFKGVERVVQEYDEKWKRNFYFVELVGTEILRTEDRIQQDYVMDFRNRFCLEGMDPRYCIFSVPNEGKDAKEQQRKKETGLLPGVSDCVVLVPGVPIFCETKTQDGAQSPDQKKFENWVTKLGFQYIVVRSTEEFYSEMSRVLKKIGKEHLIIWE